MIGSVLVLDAGDAAAGAALAARLPMRLPGPTVIHPVDGPADALATRTCAAIARAQPAPDLVVVAEGAGALLLPAVALAQRAAHRRVTEYLLVDPELPPVTDTWPDAPVTVVAGSGVAQQARLRGWLLLDRLEDWRPLDD